MMKKEIYPVPDGCKYVTVESDMEKNILLISFKSSSPGDFLCKETNHIETCPISGNLSIFWNSEDRSCAVISQMITWERSDDGIVYVSSNGGTYKNAIRFRDEEQYLKILGKWQENHSDQG